MPYHTEGNNDQYHQISSLHSNFQFSLQCQNSEFICFLTQDPVRPTRGSRLFGLRWFQTYGLASISFLEEVRRAWVWVGQAQLTMSRAVDTVRKARERAGVGGVTSSVFGPVASRSPWLCLAAQEMLEETMPGQKGALCGL